MKKINIHEAKTHLSSLVQEVLEGEEVVIARYGEPLVTLKPYKPSTPRKPGAWKGKVKIAPDFDKLPIKLEEAFRGEYT